MDELLLRELTPAVIGVLVHRGVDFATAEDAVQEALIQASLSWPDRQPADPKGWLVTVAWRKFLDVHRSEAADDTLQLFFLCAHPSLTPASAVALTLRAVAGLTTRQIAQAYLVPEATMAQRISRAKRTVRDVRFDQPGDPATVLRVLYLVFNEGYTGDVDLAAEAIRLTRQLASLTDGEQTDDEETAGLLALMLLHHARRPARTRSDGSLVPLAEQDRSRWDAAAIAEGVALISSALARAPIGPYQLQAAIAAVHDEAARADDTDWRQILVLYELLAQVAPSPVVTLNHAVALAMVRGPEAGLELLATLDGDGRMAGNHRLEAVRAHLLELAGDTAAARERYRAAARHTTSLPEQRYLEGRAARLEP